MADILEDIGHLGKTNLSSQQIVMIILQLGVRKVVPAVGCNISYKRYL